MLCVGDVLKNPNFLCILLFIVDGVEKCGNLKRQKIGIPTVITRLGSALALLSERHLKSTPNWPTRLLWYLKRVIVVYLWYSNRYFIFRETTANLNRETKFVVLEQQF